MRKRQYWKQQLIGKVEINGADKFRIVSKDKVEEFGRHTLFTYTLKRI